MRWKKLRLFGAWLSVGSGVCLCYDFNGLVLRAVFLLAEQFDKANMDRRRRRFRKGRLGYVFFIMFEVPFGPKDGG